MYLAWARADILPANCPAIEIAAGLAAGIPAYPVLAGMQD
jgi:hypothetical protein